MTNVPSGVQLITYADRLGGDIPGMTRLLRSDAFAGAFTGVHILPFFTPFDGADAGFDPSDHTAVDPRLGSWDDVRDLSTTHDTMVDLIVNHVSADNAAFQDVRERGDASPFAPMFLTMSSVFPNGATEADLTRIYRPRPGLPFTAYVIGGTQRLVWTTFTPQQVDIDVASEPGAAYLASILDAVASAGVTLVRLDAVGYAIKTPGSTSFMTPETFAFIEAFTHQARERGVGVLVEVHSYYRQQVEIGHAVDLVYDFALPPLLLHALYTGRGEALKGWMDIRPTNAVTVLDTHDGIGVIDVARDPTRRADEPERPGLLTQQEITQLVQGIHARTGGASELSTGGAASNLDIYQVNSTYYDALGRDDVRYLAARAIQFFSPGIPQVYYVGALAGGNDLELLTRTGVGRDINRHYYTSDEIAADLERPVVRALFALCRFRNEFPAFDGDVATALDGAVLTLTRRGVRRPDAMASLTVDLASGDATVAWEWGTDSGAVGDLLDPMYPQGA